MTVLITGVAELTANDDELGQLTDAALLLDSGFPAWIGSAAHAPVADVRVGVGGRAALLGGVDGDTGLVFGEVVA